MVSGGLAPMQGMGACRHEGMKAGAGSEASCHELQAQSRGMAGGFELHNLPPVTHLYLLSLPTLSPCHQSGLSTIPDRGGAGHSSLRPPQAPAFPFTLSVSVHIAEVVTLTFTLTCAHTQPTLLSSRSPTPFTVCSLLV